MTMNNLGVNDVLDELTHDEIMTLIKKFTKKNSDNVNDYEFNENVLKLLFKYNQLSKEESDTILNIAKKF